MFCFWFTTSSSSTLFNGGLQLAAPIAPPPDQTTLCSSTWWKHLIDFFFAPYQKFAHSYWNTLTYTELWLLYRWLFFKNFFLISTQADMWLYNNISIVYISSLSLKPVSVSAVGRSMKNKKLFSYRSLFGLLSVSAHCNFLYKMSSYFINYVVKTTHVKLFLHWDILFCREQEVQTPVRLLVL